MSTDPLNDQSIELPLLGQQNCQTDVASRPSIVSASDLLAISNAAKTPSNPYKTLSAPIDSIIGPFMQPGYGLQISSPPGSYVERLLIGLIKSVTGDDKEVMVVDMQNKLNASLICQSLENDERADRVYHHMLHEMDDLISFLSTFPDFLSTHPKISLLILSCLSFPFQVESDFTKRHTHLNHVRALIIKLCKHHGLVVVITTAMAVRFVNPDGTQGSFDKGSRGILVPQIDLSCKSISLLVISRTSRTSGRAVLTPATSGTKLRVEFDYVGLELQAKAP